MLVDYSPIRGILYTEAHQHFFRVAKLLIVEQEPQIDMSETDFFAARILREHKSAYEELSK